MEELKKMVMDGLSKETAQRVKQLLEEGTEADAIMRDALVAAMDEVGELFQKGEYYLPEMMIAAKAMKEGLGVLKPHLVRSSHEPAGRVIMGTVSGDLHDIGKNLVVMSLEGAGFEVIDLGIDVSEAKFIEAVREHNPDVLGISALLTTTMLNMKKIIEALKAAGLRDTVKVMVGGAPVTREFADEIGADFYGADSTAGKDFAREAVKK